MEPQTICKRCEKPGELNEKGYCAHCQRFSDIVDHLKHRNKIKGPNTDATEIAMGIADTKK